MMAAVETVESVKARRTSVTRGFAPASQTVRAKSAVMMAVEEVVVTAVAAKAVKMVCASPTTATARSVVTMIAVELAACVVQTRDARMDNV